MNYAIAVATTTLIAVACFVPLMVAFTVWVLRRWLR